MAVRAGINGVAMAAMAFLLVALLPVPGAEAQVLNCSVPCNTTYDTCLTTCSIPHPYALTCPYDCLNARDACTSSCKLGCAFINAGTKQLNCSVPCATTYSACTAECAATGDARFPELCTGWCDIAKDECTGRCKLGCATV